MMPANKQNRPVTLPEGVSLQRVAGVLLDAWQAGPHQWTDSPLQLREGPAQKPAAPMPQDAMDLFRLLAEQRVPYLLAGGLAMLTYVNGRNTKDVDLLMSAEASREIPGLEIRDRQDFFARGQFRSVQVDLLLTSNPVFKIVAEKFATRHRFAELEVPTVTVEGLMILKLYALPSLYRQFDWDRIYLYEGDIKLLLARHKPQIEPLFKLLEPHLLPTDLTELRKIVSLEQQRIAKAEGGAP
ncbi:MAG: hypothetical protein ABSG04_06795 [Verrucomicrobiota bacterium]|jgi:hypothetical protein